MDELSQLDELIESDVLEALGQENSKVSQDAEEDEISIEDFDENPDLDESTIASNNDEITIEDFDENPIVEVESKEEIIEDETQDEKNQSVTIPEINTNDLATLLSQLLNNKTIEITIKIKD